MWVLSWLIGSKVGRYAAMGLVVAGILAVVAYSLIRRGVDQERAKQIAQSLENLRSRIATDDEISRLSAAERRRRLLESWSVPDDQR